MRVEMMREIGRKVLHLITDSGLTIEEQTFMVDGLHFAIHQAVKDLSAAVEYVERKDENSY